MKRNTLTNLPVPRSWKVGIVALGVVGLLGAGGYGSGVHRLHTRNVPPPVTPSRGSQIGRQPGKHWQQAAQKKRKALLVQKINRYWQLREEAETRGIDISRIPPMPFIVGDDGNIYRILPDGRSQLVPDDQFHDPAITESQI